MDVTPPNTLRRVGIALAGVGVAALAAAACVLSFDDLRSLAITGQARPDLAYLYPAGFSALLAVALIGVLLLRSARLLVRTQAAVVLVLLIVAAAAVNAATSVRFAFDGSQTAVGVAVAPWVMLTVALWLWLLLIKHAKDRRSLEELDRTAEHDIVPFRGSKDAPPLNDRAIEHELEPTPLVGPTAAPETPAISLGERVTRWEPKPKTTEPDIDPDPIPKPRPDPDSAPKPVSEPVREPVREPVGEPGSDLDSGPEPVREPTPEPVREPTPEPKPQRRVRWGDRRKPGDVLVHPKRETDRDADTQPVRVITDDPRPATSAETAADNPDPGHGPEAADDIEPTIGPSAEPTGSAEPAASTESTGSAESTEPADAATDDGETDPTRRPPYGDAPSGRLRSTPLPPEE